MSLDDLHIRSNIRDYKVIFREDNGFLSELGAMDNSLTIIDSKAWNAHANCCFDRFNGLNTILQPISEEKKSLETVQRIYDKIIEMSPKKNLVLLAIGGGILEDIVGFVASTIYRGVKWFFVPTTLLAQADSCIGAKTSLNYKAYKNLIGTFSPPTEVWVYPHFLSTQKRVDFFSGVGEMVKLHLMGGETDTADLLAHLPGIKSFNTDALMSAIKRSLEIKKSYIEDDEFDAGKRNMLNFGHCFGHAIESATDFAIPHGQAVVLGILLANIIARERGLLSPQKEGAIRDTLLLPSLTFDIKKLKLNKNRILEAMKKDKKRTGEDLALVMMDDRHNMIGVQDLAQIEANNALDELEKVGGI